MGKKWDGISDMY